MKINVNNLVAIRIEIGKKMDREEEFLNMFFTHVAQLCTDKAKELVVSNLYKIYINLLVA